MATINAYFFATITLANAKVAEINEGENLPNNGYLTTSYCLPKPCEGGYYIEIDEVTSKYCSNPISVTNNDQIL